VDPAETSSWQAATSAHPVPRELAALPEVRIAARALWWVLGAVVVLLPLVLDDGKTSLAALVFVYALLGLSVVVLTGWAGQVSLGQAAFFGIGGAVGAALTVRSWDPGVSLIVAGLVGAFIATVVGLPALRIRGLYLAVTTLAFSVFASAYLINPDTLHWVPLPSTFIERRAMFGRIDVSSERAYYFFCVACFVIGLTMVRGFRRSRTGRALVGIRDNERAAQSFGINATRTKLTAFALSGFLAAVAGVLYTHSQQAVSLGRFTPEESLRVFTMVVIGGVGTIPGAVVGSLYLNGIQWFGGTIGTEWLRTLVAFLGTGVGLIVILLLLPAGLGDVLYRARDALLRRVASRRGLVAPGVAEAPPSQNAASQIESDPGAPGALVLHGVDVAYDGVQVLFGVSLQVEPGEIVALLGTNGAGKSTALRAVSGLTPATSGTVSFDGIDLTSLAPHRILAHGVAQCPGGRGVFPGLTVRENLRIATWPYRRDRDAVERAITEAYERFPVLEDRAQAAAGSLSGGQQQMLTLAQTFMTHPRLVMIDELSLGLAPAVVAQLTDVVRRMRDEGTTIVLVEQSVNVALTVADRAYFMEKGQVRFEGPTAELLDRPDLLRSVFVGKAGNGHHAPVRSSMRRKKSEADVLEARGLRRRFGAIAAVDDVSFAVAPGHVLGIIGPNGAGKTTLFDLISGFTTPDGGRVLIDSADVTELGPDVRSRAGLGRSFQDARLFSGLTVAETIAVAFERDVEVKDPFAAVLNMPAVSRAERVVAARVDELVDLLSLQDYRNKFVSELSTGTRRVVDLACALAHRPRVLLLDEPSSGLGQRETEALVPLIGRLHQETGAAIVVIEHDMPLISEVSHELMAMHLGTILCRGKPAEVLGNQRVIETYLGTQEAIINRSGKRKAGVRV
jgi:ABC-type branched-subunit amino acid transport system ATPase component/ABC-type branched-subunit amino acid transport system permease subunit